MRGKRGGRRQPNLHSPPLFATVSDGGVKLAWSTLLCRGRVQTHRANPNSRAVGAGRRATGGGVHAKPREGPPGGSVRHGSLRAQNDDGVYQLGGWAMGRQLAADAELLHTLVFQATRTTRAAGIAVGRLGGAPCLNRSAQWWDLPSPGRTQKKGLKTVLYCTADRGDAGTAHRQRRAHSMGWTQRRARLVVLAPPAPPAGNEKRPHPAATHLHSGAHRRLRRRRGGALHPRDKQTKKEARPWKETYARAHPAVPPTPNHPTLTTSNRPHAPCASSANDAGKDTPGAATTLVVECSPLQPPDAR